MSEITKKLEFKDTLVFDVFQVKEVDFQDPIYRVVKVEAVLESKYQTNQWVHTMPDPTTKQTFTLGIVVN